MLVNRKTCHKMSHSESWSAKLLTFLRYISLSTTSNIYMLNKHYIDSLCVFVCAVCMRACVVGAWCCVHACVRGVWVHVCMRVCMRVCMLTCMRRGCMCACLRVWVRGCMCACVCVCVCGCVHACKCVCSLVSPLCMLQLRNIMAFLITGTNIMVL